MQSTLGTILRKKGLPLTATMGGGTHTSSWPSTSRQQQQQQYQHSSQSVLPIGTNNLHTINRVTRLLASGKLPRLSRGRLVVRKRIEKKNNQDEDVHKQSAPTKTTTFKSKHTTRREANSLGEFLFLAALPLKCCSLTDQGCQRLYFQMCSCLTLWFHSTYS